MVHAEERDDGGGEQHGREVALERRPDEPVAEGPQPAPERDRRHGRPGGERDVPPPLLCGSVAGVSQLRPIIIII